MTLIITLSWPVVVFHLWIRHFKTISLLDGFKQAINWLGRNQKSIENGTLRQVWVHP